MHTKKVVLDSSFISALINCNDVHYERAHRHLITCDDSQFLIPIVVRLELVLLPHALKSKEMHTALQEFFSSFPFETVWIDESFLSSYEHTFSLLNCRIKPFDLTVVTSAIKYKAKLLTFDEKLLKYWDIFTR